MNISGFLVSMMVLSLAIPLAAAPRADERPRVIVTTDGEIDDKCSFVRFLLYTNDFDVAGLVYVNSKFHYPGHDFIEPDWMPPLIAKYEAVRVNLQRHDPLYPEGRELTAVVKTGNMKAEGGMAGVGEGKDSEGSDHIMKVLLDKDPRPVWIQAWGGTNTIAQAFYRIKTSKPAALAGAVSKARIYSISDQDFGTSSLPWLAGQFPGLVILKNMKGFLFIAYPHSKQRVTPAELRPWLSKEWIKKNIREGHGPLNEAYPRPNAWAVGIFPVLGPAGGDAFVSEGDSPAYFHVINTGLRSHEKPGYGGWGQRFAPQKGGVWIDVEDGRVKQYSGHRWLAAIQSDWAARADWCVKPAKEANHHPVVVVAGGLDRTAAPGASISLDAEGTSDPDGDDLEYSWWQYHEADSANTQLQIANATNKKTSFVVPDEPGREVHIILQVTDKGTPALTRYRRVVVTIK